MYIIFIYINLRLIMMMIGCRVPKILNIMATRYSFALFKQQKRWGDASNTSNSFKERGSRDNKILFTEEDSKKIEEVNQYFQGIRYNTSYTKYYNEDSRSQQANLSSQTIANLPFRGTAKQLAQIQPTMSEVAEKLFNKIPQNKLEQRIKELCKSYFTDLLKGENKSQIEPNFEREGRRTALALIKDGHNFQLSEFKDTINYQVESVSVLRGVEVIRNNNYTTDSYTVQEEDGYTFYKLVQKGSQKLPEDEWFRQKNVILRIVVNVEAPCKIKITKKGEQVFSNGENPVHQFVLEMDLRRPPQFSDFSMTPLQYMAAYRPNISGLTITDVDKQNIYTAYTYDDNTKKNKLINKLK